MKTHKRQSGVALLTALLVVALATVAAASMATRQQLDMRRTGNMLHSEQAWAYALGAESWARVVLARDSKDTKVDNLSEDWAIQVPASLVEGGSVIGRVIDLQGRFNVNSLVVNGVADPAAMDRYKRLLRTLGLDESLAETLADWLDTDINSLPLGAEDETYLLLIPPYRAANRLMVDVSELRLVKGYNKKAMSVLLGGVSGSPLVTALPRPTAINVNTASAEVLTTLANGLTVSDGETIIEARGDTGFEKIQELLQLQVLASKPKLDTKSLAVQSQWFLLVSEANVGQGRVKLASLIQRTKLTTRVIRRQREFFDWVQVPVVATN